MKRKVIFAVAVLAVSVVSAATTFAAEPGFTDTKVSDWYYPYMSKLVDKGAINGYPDQTFKPKNTMSNAEFVTSIVGATIGKQEKTGKHWASGYMDAARTNEMLIGDEMQEADWNKPVTRQQMAVIIGRTTEKILKEEPLADTEKFQAEIKDYDKLCDYCKPYVLQSYGKGIISGYPDGTFAGEKTATRAEVCSMLTRMLEPADRTTEKVTEPEEKGAIKEIISNPEDILGGSKLETYVISDPKLWDMELSSGRSEGKSKAILMKDPGMTFFVVNGKARAAVGRYRADDGRFAILYETSGLGKTNNTEIETVDYIGSYYSTGTVLTLIPNPFKK